ncbi:hypothetical protein [Arcticibacter sp. MXS-1]|uniref:hypothetical protein n=1 Tax=Arcticibacter sp. MXS-1 TaxID=3341726 RepID=UPI0035A92680
MNRLCFFFLMLCALSGRLFGQQVPDYDSVKLQQPGDYAVAESAALAASNYILSTPVTDDAQRLKSMQFLIRWMGGTPDYKFVLDGPVVTMRGDNSDLLGVYMACMTKFCIENKVQCKDAEKVTVNSVRSLLSYCSNPSNGIRMKAEMKRLKEADEKGRLEAALK